MKKILIAAMISVVILGFWGCTKVETEAPSGVPKSPTSAQAKVLLQNNDARRAIALAFDKNVIVDEILANGSEAIHYFVPKGLAVDAAGADFRQAYPEGWLEYNPTLAKDHWEKAKSDLGITHVTLDILGFDSMESMAVCEYIKGQLEQHLTGLTVTINAQPFKNKLDLSYSGAFSIEYLGWAPDYPDPMTFLDLFMTHGGHNNASYSDEDYDAVISSAKTGELANDVLKRWQMLQELERKLVEEDVVVIPLYQRGMSYLTSSEVKGINHHAFGGAFTYNHVTTTRLTNGKKILRLIGNSDIPTMDTNLATNSTSFEVMANVLEGLVRLGTNDVLEPGVAHKWGVSTDGKTYTFQLREDAKWSNGERVTAHDFVYSWRRLANPDTGSRYNFMLETAQIVNYDKVIRGELDPTELGVKALDDYTLEVKLETPVPYFVKLMTFPNFYPVNESFVQLKGNLFGSSTENTLYNGPFTLSQWDVGYGYALTKNEDYWNADGVKIDGVTFRVVKDMAAGVNLFETGEVDRCNLSSDYVKRYENNPEFETLRQTAVFYLTFNLGE